MLQFVRSKQKSVLIKIAFGVIILSFVIGYTMLTAPSDQGANQGRDIAATVNGTDISYGDFQTSYSNLYNLYQNIYQGNFDSTLEKQLNLPKQALQQLINQTLLMQLADTLNIDVSKDELVASIANYDEFKLDGKFNRDRYIEVLSYKRMKPEQFEAMQQRQLITQKVRDSLQEDVTLSDEDFNDAFHKENDKVNLNYVWLTPELVESKVNVTDAGLQEFFDKNIEQFRIAKKVSLRYLQFDPARYENEVGALETEELQRFYRRNLDLYETKEQVKAAHILLSIPKDAKPETIKKRQEFAQQLLQQLRDGADFSQLAKTHSDDKGNANKGGSLGTFGRGIMVPEFEKAAFALQAGQLSDVVTTPFGLHIIKAEEHIESGVKPLVEVIGAVKAGAKLEKSRQLAYEKAMDAYNINRKTGNLEAAASDNDLGIKETGFFAIEDAIDGIGRVAAVSQAAFTLTDKELARPIQTTQGVFLITTKEQQPSHLPELTQVKPQVEEAFRAEQAQTLAKDLADKLLAQATEANSLNKAAKALNLAVEESGKFSRNFGAFIPRIGSSQELADEAFVLTKAAPVASQVYTISNKFLIACLKDIDIADPASIQENDRTQLENRLLTEKKEKQITDKLKELQEQADIEILTTELLTAFNKGSN